MFPTHPRRRRTVLATMLVSCGATLAAASPAAAETFCVHDPEGCSGTEKATLQQALDAAQANGNGKDTIRVGTGLFNDLPAVNEAGNPVEIIGEATNKTALSTNSTQSGVTLLEIREPTSKISKLRIHHKSAAPVATGISLKGDADEVMVTNQLTTSMGTSLSFDGIQVAGPGVSISNSAVAIVYPNDKLNRGIVVLGAGEAQIRDSSIDSAVGVSVIEKATVLRTRIRAVQGVVAGGGSDVKVRDTQIRLPGSGDSILQHVALYAYGTGTTKLDADRVTAYGGNHPSSYGTWLAPTAGAGNSVDLDVQGSIFDSFAIDHFVAEPGGSESHLTATWSAYELASVALACTACYTQSNNVDTLNVNPRFVDAANGNLSLKHNSPYVDAGDPSFQPNLIAFDVHLNARVRDGKGTGTSVVDLGASEYQRRAPVANALADPTAAETGQQLTFDASGSSDPDPGDKLTYTWSFDDGSTANGKQVQHAFATPGQHTATVTVTDPTGLQATASVNVDITQAPQPPQPPAPQPPAPQPPAPQPEPGPGADPSAGGDGPGAGPAGGEPGGPNGTPGDGPSGATPAGTAPQIQSLSLQPRRFRAGNASRRRAGRGTTIAFRLSESARTTLTIERKSVGRRQGRTCRKPTARNRRGRKCTLWVRVGTLTRSGNAGTNTVAWDGRIGRRTLAAGSYRLSAQARDGEGLTSPVRRAAFTIVQR